MVIQKNKDAFFHNSTFHGLADLHRTKRCAAKLAWSVILGAGLLAAGVGCYAILDEFIQRRTVISYLPQEIDHHRLALPDVVVCPFNRFNRSFLIEQGISFNLSQYLELAFPLPVKFDFQKKQFLQIHKNIDLYQKQLEELLVEMGNISLGEFIDMATLRCDSLLMVLAYSEKTNCTEMETIMTSVGKCLRIPGRDQKGVGYGTAMHMVFNLPHHLYNPGHNQLLNDGVALKLVERGRSIGADLIFIPAGVHALLPIRATKYEFMNVPGIYDCNPEVDPTYSAVFCFDQCVIKEATELCGCIPAAIAHSSVDLPYCTARDLFACFLTEVFRNQASKFAQCRAQCRQPCSYWQYQTRMSHGPLPSPQVLNFLQGGENGSTWQMLSNSIILEVFYERSAYTLVKHRRTMTAGSCLAEIGGQMSLWVGGSALTLVQIVLFCLNSLLCDREEEEEDCYESHTSVPMLSEQ